MDCIYARIDGIMANTIVQQLARKDKPGKGDFYSS
jgi:hypothetical protein